MCPHGVTAGRGFCCRRRTRYGPLRQRNCTQPPRERVQRDLLSASSFFSLLDYWGNPQPSRADRTLPHSLPPSPPSLLPSVLNMPHMLEKMLGMQKEFLGRKQTGNQIIIMQCDSVLVRSKPRAWWELRRGAELTLEHPGELLQGSGAAAPSSTLLSTCCALDAILGAGWAWSATLLVVWGSPGWLGSRWVFPFASGRSWTLLSAPFTSLALLGRAGLCHPPSRGRMLIFCLEPLRIPVAFLAFCYLLEPRAKEKHPPASMRALQGACPQGPIAKGILQGSTLALSEPFRCPAILHGQVRAEIEREE